MMDCLQLTETGELEPTETEISAPGPTDVMVDVEATSVGLTVYNAINGLLGSDRGSHPRIPGHEIVGRCAALVADGTIEPVVTDLLDTIAAGDHVGRGTVVP